jgi:beta-glucosidase
MMLFAKPNQGKQVYQYATAFPVGTAMAQTWNVPLLEKFGDAIGVEMEEFGVTFWLAPGMNIQRNPLCGRNYEYYSEDPVLTGKMAAAAIRGVQSHDGCYATIKHFAANNQEQLRNHSDSIVSERALREIYLKGFKIAVREGGAKSLMTSYNLLNGVYTANSYDLCTKLLRQEWGFSGVVMSDWFATGKDMANNGLAIKSGNDLIMPGGKGFLKRLKKDLRNSLVSEEDINCSCARILEAIANSRTQRELEERKNNC